ncbi:ImmA/IrrE family metallo-endopeptidase [Actinoalloteichus caeruleus]|uniref:ImmA/IrrE family metallo-endopeptidase n=1 Tax=Actinoalloteichus cyanogriseus TaxID=2893586 RepID=UPI003AACB94A
MTARLNLSAARRRATNVLRGITLPSPWSLPDFIADVARARGRPIMVEPATMSRHAVRATAFWVAEPDLDLIVVDDTGSELYQENAVLHELAHILLGHQGLPLPRGHHDSEEPPRVSHRRHRPDQRELEAETLAYAIWRAAGRARALTIAAREPNRLLTGAFENPGTATE